ncbi:MAG TPA: hypothetical protein VI259_00550 [Gemmatimonadaceae bacterium]
MDARIAKQGMIETRRLAGYTTFGQCGDLPRDRITAYAATTFAIGVSGSSSGAFADPRRCVLQQRGV